MQHGKRTLLSSAFHTRAELHGTLRDVRRSIGSMPNMTPISTGTRLRYAVEGIGVCDGARSVVELTANEITFRFFFEIPDVYDYKRNLLRFLAILAYLKELYTVSLGGIYSYLIEALRQDDCMMVHQGTGSRESTMNGRIEVLNGINVSLSHELSLRSAQIRGMDRKLDSYKAFSKEIIGRLVQRSGKGPSDAISVLSAIGIDKSLADEIASLTSEGARRASDLGI